MNYQNIFKPGDKVIIDPEKKMFINFSNYPDMQKLYDKQGYFVVSSTNHEWLRFRGINMDRNGKGWLFTRFKKIGSVSELPEELFEL